MTVTIPNLNLPTHPYLCDIMCSSQAATKLRREINASNLNKKQKLPVGEMMESAHCQRRERTPQAHIDGRHALQTRDASLAFPQQFVPIQNPCTHNKGIHSTISPQQLVTLGLKQGCDH